jgi:hypothetical protein
MPIFRNYSPDDVKCAFFGITITGFAEGTFIEIEREVDTFTKKVGALGDVARSRSLNKSGKITITVMDAHPINDLLATVISDDEFDGSQAGPFTMKDLFGNTEVRATNAWCMKVPKVTRAQASGNVVYVFEAASLFIKHGSQIR